MFSCIAFSIFAVLMMMNFLAATIASSKKQIGILCALGASMKEVTGIYSLESLVIGISAFALSLPGIFGISYLMNDMLYAGSVQIPFMIVEYQQLLATFALGVITCTMGSILPIVRLAKKKPIEMIND